MKNDSEIAERRRESKRLWIARWRANNPDLARQQNREYYARWRSNNPERSRQQIHEWTARFRSKNPELTRKRSREYSARWRANNIEMARKLGREWAVRWRANNLELARKRSRDSYANPSATRKAWYLKTYSHRAAMVNAWKARTVSELNDYYVRSRLARGTVIPSKKWPQSIVELKRAQLKLKRICRNPKI